MKYWWVNQNQTAKQEVSGGYMWSPKRNANGARNPFYENMRECSPGDVVFSYVDTRISTVGVVTSFCEESPKPDEFGTAGDRWDADGWRVNVDYSSLVTSIKPAEHIAAISPTLPEKYSPLRQDGQGNQVYLTRVPAAMAQVLLNLIGSEAAGILSLAGSARTAVTSTSDLQDIRNDSAEAAIRSDKTLPETERQSLVKSRRGQGVFRERVASLEPRCRVTGVTNITYRIASHIKPWSKCTHKERLDGHNGLLLAPHIDHLFDNGFVSFSDEGGLLISPIADLDALRLLGVPVDGSIQTGEFTLEQKKYLAYHRDEVFKKSATGAPAS